eukprot:NODE_1574_length_576_cov_9.261860_g1268_i0.p2 GENE.NODE_1574_length_576_cov_9.261860_g1268_i0~~NODE_1574_length_576_cov_9.261860_g1268_i0.p2  ORF type:complete len:55 (+),score=2.52 NODE_1574_length_576_cov_9.261860_g1268_i0:158-322(+)
MPFWYKKGLYVTTCGAAGSAQGPNLPLICGGWAAPVRTVLAHGAHRRWESNFES